MSELFSTKQLDGYAAKFTRFAGPENLIIEVNGAERKVSREVWHTLPDFDERKVHEPSK
jgi:hypothetical protein